MKPTKMIFQSLSSATALWALALASTCYGQFGDRENDSDNGMALRTYELGDLVVTVPDYALESNRQAMRAPSSSGGSFSSGGGGFGGSGGGMAGFGADMAANVGGGPSSAPLTMGAIIDVMTLTVAPKSWRQSGGAGEAAALGTTLVVRQTPEIQQAIGQLLDALRDGSAKRRSVAIDTRWLLLDSDQLEALTAGVGDDGEPTINREALARFTRQPTSLRGFISCFSGQSVFLTSGTVRSNVSSYIPVVGSVEAPEPAVMLASHSSSRNGRFLIVSDSQPGGCGVGYQPVITTNNYGVQIELRPTRLDAEQAAVVDLRSTITFPGSPSKVDGLDATTSRLAPQVDRIAIQTQELATTLRVPLGKPVLVGGMTYIALDPAAATETPAAAAVAPAEDAAEKTQAYLILEVR